MAIAIAMIREGTNVSPITGSISLLAKPLVQGALRLEEMMTINFTGKGYQSLLVDLTQTDAFLYLAADLRQ